MRILAMSLAVSLAACGVDMAERPLGRSHCEVSNGAVWMYSDSPGLKCDAAQADFDLAMEMLTKDRVGTEGALMAAFFGVTVKVEPVYKFYHDGSMVLGYYNSRTRVLGIAKQGGPLIHELLHVWEDSQGLGGGHVGWKEKGYDEMQVWYDSFCQPLF